MSTSSADDRDQRIELWASVICSLAASMGVSEREAAELIAAEFRKEAALHQRQADLGLSAETFGDIDFDSL